MKPTWYPAAAIALALIAVAAPCVAQRTPTPTPTPAPQCVGDCDGNGAVTAAEVAACQDIELGNQPVSVCPSCDVNGDGFVTPDEVAAAQQSSINGCGPPANSTPVADFYFYPADPSVFDTVQFIDSSFDPDGVGFQTFAWDFGDGATATGGYPTHLYAVDGDYTVQHMVMTVDGRTAANSHLVHVQTHDVAIIKFSPPTAARLGQTRQISVGVNSKRYPETVQVSLLKSLPGNCFPVGCFEVVGSLTQSVPVRPSNRTTDFNFSYTFTSDDAAIGKVTFATTASIVGARDAFQADNQALSSPTKVSR